MADMPVASAAAPAPAAPAPSAPSTPAPAASPAPAAPAAPAEPAAPAGGGAAPADPAAFAAPVAPAAPAAFDPKTSVTPPDRSKYPENQQGMADYLTAKMEWNQSHPEQAEAQQEARRQELAREDGLEAPQADPPQPDEVQPQAEEPKAGEVVAATPARLEEWAAKSPEFKAALDKDPALKAEVMELARGYEAAQPVLEIVSTREEAQFAVENAHRLIALQTASMLGADDPAQMDNAFGMALEMFKERDAEGKEVLGADGKPKFAADLKPFANKFALARIQDDLAAGVTAQIQALEAKLGGVYPSEEAKAADGAALEDLKYEKAAFDFVIDRLKSSAGDASAAPLPALPPNATPEQIAFQKKLEEQQAALDAKAGKQTAEGRKAAQVAVNRAVQGDYEAGLNTFITTEIDGMKGRGEYLPEFVLTDKWVNPATGQQTQLPVFNVKLYQQLNDKINSNPLHAAKLAQLEALGAAGKDARIKELTRLRSLYLPKLFQAEVKRIQDGIRSSQGQRQAAPVPPASAARVEPNSGGISQPAAMDATQARKWAEAEVTKMEGYQNMSQRDREAQIIALSARKRFGG